MRLVSFEGSGQRSILQGNLPAEIRVLNSSFYPKMDPSDIKIQSGRWARRAIDEPTSCLIKVQAYSSILWEFSKRAAKISIFFSKSQIQPCHPQMAMKRFYSRLFIFDKFQVRHHLAFSSPHLYLNEFEVHLSQYLFFFLCKCARSTTINSLLSGWLNWTKSRSISRWNIKGEQSIIGVVWEITERDENWTKFIMSKVCHRACRPRKS